MYLICFLAFCDLFAVSLLLPALGGHFLYHNVVWIGSIYGISQFFSQPLFGAYADRLGIRFTAIISILISSLSYYLLSLGTNVYIMVLARVIAGIFKQTQELSRLAIVNSESQKDRAGVLGMFNSIGSAAFILGPIVGGHIREYFSDGIFICAKLTSILFLFNAVLVYFLMPDIKNVGTKKTEEKKAVKPHSTSSILLNMWDVCLVRLFLTMGILMTRFVVPILTDRAFGPAKSGYLTSLTGVMSTVSASAASVIAPKVLRKMNAVIAEAFVTLGIFLTLISMGLSWSTYPNWLIFLSVLFINCFFTQMSRILLTELTVERAPVEMRGSVMGTVTSLTAVSRAGCDLAIAFLLNYHDILPIYCGGFLSLISTGILWKFSAKKVKLD